MFNSSEPVAVAAGATAGGDTTGLRGRPQPWSGPAARIAVGTGILAGIVALSLYGPEAGIPAFETYKALLYLHVTIALVTFGSTFAMPVLQPLAARGGVVTLRLALRFAEQLERVIIAPGSFLVIATGIGLIFSDMTGYRHDLPVWLILALAWVVVALILAQGFQAPDLKRALELLEETPDEGPMPAALAPIAMRMKPVGQLLSLSTLGIMFLMIWKPGA